MDDPFDAKTGGIKRGRVREVSCSSGPVPAQCRASGRAAGPASSRHRVDVACSPVTDRGVSDRNLGQVKLGCL